MIARDAGATFDAFSQRLAVTTSRRAMLRNVAAFVVTGVVGHFSAQGVQARRMQSTCASNADCQSCEVCDTTGAFGGGCIPKCMAACQSCDTNGNCVSTCGTCEMCDTTGAFGGGCIPKCPQTCQTCDTNGDCVSLCAACEVCTQDQCQSACPNPCEVCDGATDTCRPCNGPGEQCFGGVCQRCDPDCERFDSQAGTCVSTCPGGQTCCKGACLECCGPCLDNGLCDNSGVELGNCSFISSNGDLLCCEGGCHDAKTDHVHCGDCNTHCLTLQECCGGQCTDTDSDDAHCGSCSNDCTQNVTNTKCCHGVCAQPDEPCGQAWTVEVTEQTTRNSPPNGIVSTSQGTGKFTTLPDSAGITTFDDVAVDLPDSWSWTVQSNDYSDMCSGSGNADTVDGGLRLRRVVTGPFSTGQLEVVIAMGYTLGLCAPNAQYESLFVLAQSDPSIYIDAQDGATITETRTMALNDTSIITTYTITLHTPAVTP